MSWLQLDPQSLADRVQGTGGVPSPPSLMSSMLRGAAGFALVSVAGFAPWAFAGRQIHRAVGEAGLYTICAAIFIGLSGALLHRLIMGRASLGRFYVLFSGAFAAYALVWTAGWMSLRGHLGSTAGLLGGAVVMGWILASAFGARNQLVKIVAALFISNALGYFIGGWVESYVVAGQGPLFFGLAVHRSERRIAAMLLWGLCYGIGFGAGIGLAFYQCQAKAREILRASHDVPAR